MLLIKQENILEYEADALVLTFDGENAASHRGADFVTGNLASAFRDRWPEAWPLIEEAVHPDRGLVPCGDVVSLELTEGSCAFGGVVLASTLRHHGDRSHGTMSRIVASAVEGAVRAARAEGWESLASTPMKGGPRLDTRSAFMAMVEGYRKAAKALAPGVPDLAVCDSSAEGFAVIDKAWKRILKGAGG